ncbi:sigma-54-dependent Fis family transcriptional regulator [Sphingobacteriales bacterium UPWRP_1]|nr:sigma-54-dependent Fis family transcriptional regulator [Sphingobacteriales bacterium UPWRP_1]
MEIQAIKQRFGIIGNSPGLNNALSVATRVAPTDLTVLILGESGVGKEVFSQIIHALSPRKHNSLIAVNCGAIPEGTIDSELFGHEKGSFTGATDSRKGYFEVVNGGTIFLDEIGEMPLGTQSRLLRVLESGEFIRVGSSKVQKTDVRVIAATNVNLLEAVKAGKFREDLYYRLNTVPIYIPPLRERREDIVLLFRKFSADFAERYRTSPITLEPDSQDLLMAYPWPGNIRELKNVAEQASVLSVKRPLPAEELKPFLTNANSYETRFPVLSGFSGKQQGEYNFSEREILYKILFDLRQEMSEVKQLLLQLAGGVLPPNSGTYPAPLMPPAANTATPKNYTIGTDNRNLPPYGKTGLTDNTSGGITPILVNRNKDTFPPDDFPAAVIVDESLSLTDNERELIQRALKKHKNKRKDAAFELGISERTLYRKIKEYNIKE